MTRRGRGVGIGGSTSIESLMHLLSNFQLSRQANTRKNEITAAYKLHRHVWLMSDQTGLSACLSCTKELVQMRVHRKP